MRTVNDRVWCAKFNSHQLMPIECPDCAGTARVRVMLADDTVVSVDCGGCSRGYDPSTGYQLINMRECCADLQRIVEVRQTAKGNEYLTENHHIHTDESVFDNEADALAYAEKLQADYIEEQKKRILEKEKPLKTWAWNASYHRTAIKDAEKKINYHTAKLNAANLKVKA